MRAGGKAVISLADSAASSVSNFLGSLAVAMTASARDFGIFASLFAGYLVLMGVVRAVSSEPLVTRRLELDKGHAPARVDSWALGVAAGLSGAICVAVLALCVPLGWTNAYTVIVLTGAPFLVVQDCCRFVAFSKQDPARALVLDLLWLGWAVAGYAVMLVGGVHDGAVAAAVWVTGGLVSCLWAIAASRVIPSLKGLRAWFSENRLLVGPYVGEALLGVGTSQAAAGLLAVIGVSLSGAWRGAATLVGPLTTAIVGASSFALPAMVGHYARQDCRSMLRLSVVTSVLLGLISGGWLTALLFMPESLGSWLLGDTWQAAEDVLPAAGVWMACIAVGTGAQLLVRATQYARLGLLLRTTGSACLVGVLFWGIAVGSSNLAVWGFATSAAVFAAASWCCVVWIIRREPKGSMGRIPDVSDRKLPR